MRKISKLLVFAFIIIYSVSFAKHPINHGLWNQVLIKHVSVNGNVNYEGIKNDLNFKKYISILSANPPKDTWTEQEKLTYWINAYNAFTVQLILNHYPVKSIKDIGTPTKGPWDMKFIKIGLEMYSLGDIEHEILRKKFNEPRIHFAIVCASISCPNLRNEAFQEDILETQLNEQTIKFINSKSKNNISSDKAELSEIFNWFKSDFTKNGSLNDFINKYSKVKMTNKSKILFLNYDWNLNK